MTDDNKQTDPKQNEPSKIEPAKSDASELEKAKRELAEYRAAEAERKLKDLQDKQPDPTKAGKLDNKFLDGVDDQIKKDKDAAAHDAVLQDAIEFNFSVDGFVEKNAKFLPESMKVAIKHLKENSTQYNDKINQANHTRQIMLDNFFRLEDNVKSMPDYASARVQEYIKLSEVERRSASVKYWDLILIALNQLSLVSKAKQASIANGGGVSGDVADYNERFFKNSHTRILNGGNKQ